MSCFVAKRRDQGRSKPPYSLIGRQSTSRRWSSIVDFVWRTMIGASSVRGSILGRNCTSEKRARHAVASATRGHHRYAGSSQLGQLEL